jgi:NAD(P)-dependent dehydrogenase (short-subunit alcohol dehydrogenase family)
LGYGRRFMELQGRTALITGGAKRVGRAVVLELARHGANVVVHCRHSRAAAERTCAAARALGVGAAVVNGDLGLKRDAERIAVEARAAFGSVDVLVNNASVFAPTPLETLTAETWERTLSVNLTGPSVLALQLGRWMRDSDGGCIVNIADWAALRPYREFLPYCVSKAGLVALTHGLARALAPRVRVHCVAPGPVLPPENYTDAERAALARVTPLGRLGTPEAVAHMVRFLVAEADFSTGGVYLVDGGRLHAGGAGPA